MNTITNLPRAAVALIATFVFLASEPELVSAQNLSLAECTFAVQLGLDNTNCASLEHEPGQIIVKFGGDISEEDRSAIVQQHGCSIIDLCESGDFHLVEIPESEIEEEMRDSFKGHDEVEYAELNYLVRIFFVPNDTFFSYQWNFYNSVNDGINMEAAWDIQTGDPNVIVAVLDTGVAYENYGIYKQAPDLAETLFVSGYDFVNDDTHPNDDNGHGTHVTGTIAQSTNNDLGVAGIAFDCSIMPVKVLSKSGEGNYFNIAQGIYFAAENSAKVMSMSFGSPANSNTLRNAVAFAYEAGVTLVCAAGNEYIEDNAASYPAAYDDYCIAVGATRYDQTRSYYSNTGGYIDIAAPGGDLTVDQNNDGYPDGVLQQTFTLEPDVFAYWFFQGTSMATPHVSGAAALVISNGTDDPEEVREALEMSAIDLGDPGWDPEYGWGLLDVWAALNYPTGADEN
jgi:serine protease